jgi:phosphohistidine phosphatase SixA
MQYFIDRLSYQNKYNLLLFIKSVVQLDTSNLKFKLHTISAVKFNMLIKRIFCFSILFLCFLDASGNSLELTLAEYAEKPFGNVIFLRHAFAPGFDANGEPDKFEIDDCSTQRNLSAIGRKQAANIGEKFFEKGIRIKTIYSSQWCRCLETAELLKLGEVIPEPSLNSGFKGIFNKEISLLKLKEILKTLENEKQIFLMVTHYGTITAMTGIFVDSGGAVAYNSKTNEYKKILFE